MTQRIRHIYKPQAQVAVQDNIRTYRPTIVKPIEYKPKYDEQLIKLPGRKPQVVRRRNETISADNRSIYQKNTDEKKAVKIKQKYEQQKNQQEAAKGMQSIIKLVSPSTYAGAVARSLTGDGSFGDNLFSGNGFNNTTANIAFDLAFPFALKYGSKIGGEFLQNQMPGLFDPYTTFRGSLGYYGNSLMDRVIGTYGRRFHLPVKSRMPELFRAEKKGINLENMMGFENKSELGRFPWQNTTTSTVVRDHSKGHWSGSDVVVKNPNMYDPKAYLSTQPSDTFILKGHNADSYNPANYTIVSGNTELLKKAKDAGYETLSTPKLRKKFAEMQAEKDAAETLFNQTNRSSVMRAFTFRKAGTYDEEIKYTNYLRKLLKKRGQPTYGDYVYQSEQTGLPITVSRDAAQVPGTSDLNRIVSDNGIFYNRTTPLEAQIRKQLGIGAQGISLQSRMQKGYTNDFLRQVAIGLNKKLYEM